MIKQTVVILLSDKRSGSTMFENEICRHPDINPVAYSPHADRETHHWLNAAGLLGMPKQLYYGHAPYKGYGIKKTTRRYLIDCIKGNVPEFVVPEDDENLIFKGWEALCTKFAKPVFFEKSPQHPHHWAALHLMLKWIQTTAFDVKIIGLVRNPMAVMYSAQKLFKTDPFERQFGWVNCYRNILAIKEVVGGEQFHMVRYEDLISNPNRAFCEICDYLGLAHSSSMGEGVHGRSVQKWLKDPEFDLQLHESAVHIAQYLGYGKEAILNPPKPGLARNEKTRRKIEGLCKLTYSRFIDRFLKPILLDTLKRKK